MRRLTHLAVIVLALAISLPVFAGSDIQSNKDAEKEVKQAVALYYKALNAMFTGDLDPMKEIWSHADDVTYLGPSGGIEVGWAAVLADWQRQAAMKLGGKVDPVNLRITVGKDIAVANSYVKGQNKGAKGEIQEVLIRATSVFRKEDGRWKMIGLHVDLLPFLKK